MFSSHLRVQSAYRGRQPLDGKFAFGPNQAAFVPKARRKKYMRYCIDLRKNLKLILTACSTLVQVALGKMRLRRAKVGRLGYSGEELPFSLTTMEPNEAKMVLEFSSHSNKEKRGC